MDQENKSAGNSAIVCGRRIRHRISYLRLSDTSTQRGYHYDETSESWKQNCTAFRVLLRCSGQAVLFNERRGSYNRWQAGGCPTLERLVSKILGSAGVPGRRRCGSWSVSSNAW